MPGDLHTHTTFSDGCIPIAQLPPLAAWADMQYLSVTDHDTFAAHDYALQHPQQNGVHLIPGVELSAWDENRKRKVHLLCYGANKTPALQQHIQRIADSRNKQQRQSIEALLKLYPFLRQEEILQKAADSGVVYKAHIMRTLREYALTDAIYGDLYRQLLGRGGSCHASPSYRAPVRSLLQAAHEAQAVVVLAHPGVYDSMELAQELAREGAIDGVEIQHPGNSPAVRIALRNMAMEYGLIVTGGTDYHGMNSDRICPVGSCTTADAQLERLLELMQKKHR